MHILAIWLIAMPGTLRSGETPVVFARSGQRFSLPASIGYKSHQGPLAFWAFGKPWGEPMVMEDDKVEFVAPSVRVPIVFQLKSNRDTHCELVVYPDQPFSWDQDVEFAAVMASDWFTTWAKATDMPVEFLEIRDLHAPAAWRSRKSRGLLILENSVYRESADVAWHLAKKHETNVLWLGADWFAANMGMQPAMVLLPAQMVGPLADLQPQDWPLPPAFDQKRPWILNRQTWIVGPVHPLVEETRIPEKGKEHLRVVWSYLPWARQLGRNEAADALFIRLLTEAAQGAKDRAPLDGRWRLLYPSADEIKADERPVLAAAMQSAEADSGATAAESREVCGCVIDFRGRTPGADFLAKAGFFQGIEERIGPQSPLLILGDHPILDAWKWLKLDRGRRRSLRPDVVWLADNSLPPSWETQVRLMQIFTDWNVSLGNNFPGGER